MIEFDHSIPPDSIYLISADRPGCGMSTLSASVRDAVSAHVGSVGLYSIGEIVRDNNSVSEEAQMNAALGNIRDPHQFDPIIYQQKIPQAGVVVVDGKIATTVGPLYIGPDRPIVCVDLTAPLVFSTKRVMQRQGFDLASIFSHEHGATFIDFYNKIKERSEHDNKMKDDFVGIERADGKKPNIVGRFAIDTSMYSSSEALAIIMGGGEFDKHSPDWELEALVRTQKNLHSLALDIKDANARDLIHFRHQMESISYGVERLAITTNPVGIEVVREDLKRAIVDAWFGLMLKKTLRFFEDPATLETVIDDETHQWSPDFYKIAEGWPTLSKMLKGQVILDPFAGSGTLTNLLVARDIPAKAYFSDLAYRGGAGRVGSRNLQYNPELNRDAARLLFDELPSWYKPSFDKAEPFRAADAKYLPYSSDSVDYIFADPPYGKNLDTPGIGLLFGCLPELNRVSSKGSVLLVPVSWLRELKGGGVVFEQLTKDLSNGTSKLPVCYIFIPKHKDNKRRNVGEDTNQTTLF